jgi:hypothetical protein
LRKAERRLADDQARVEKAAEPLGFTIHARPMHFRGGEVEIRRVSKVVNPGQILSLDLLLVTDAVRPAWEGRQTMEWDFGKISVVSREGLVSLKSLRASGLDQDDIKRLRGEVE